MARGSLGAGAPSLLGRPFRAVSTTASLGTPTPALSQAGTPSDLSTTPPTGERGLATAEGLERREGDWGPCPVFSHQAACRGECPAGGQGAETGLAASLTSCRMWGALRALRGLDQMCPSPPVFGRICYRAELRLGESGKEAGSAAPTCCLPGVSAHGCVPTGPMRGDSLRRKHPIPVFPQDRKSSQALPGD